MSEILASALKAAISGVLSLRDRTRAAKTLGLLIEKLNEDLVIQVPTSGGSLAILGGRSRYVAAEAAEFNTTEPEMLAWMDSMAPGDRLWDIGAAVGFYTMYAARRGVLVTAFEPKGMSFGVLVEHIARNGLGSLVFPVCAALSDHTGLDQLYLRDLIVGGTMNKLSGTTDQFGDGASVFAQGVPVYRCDDFITLFGAPLPDHLKIDVDGVEGLIIRGAAQILLTVKSAMIEVEGSNAENAGATIDAPLALAGLTEVLSVRNQGSNRNRLFVRTHA